MQLLKLSHMLDRATTPHLLCLGKATFRRDSQDDGDDGCIYASVHMSGLANHHFQAGVYSNTSDEMLKMQLYRWNFWAIYLGSSTPVSVALFTWRFCTGFWLSHYWGGYVFIVLHYSLVPFVPFKFASHD